jgi:hypothetical protein
MAFQYDKQMIYSYLNMVLSLKFNSLSVIRSTFLCEMARTPRYFTCDNYIYSANSPVLECRGTVVRLEKSKWTLKTRPFEKFFNQWETNCPVSNPCVFNSKISEYYFVEKVLNTYPLHSFAAVAATNYSTGRRLLHSALVWWRGHPVEDFHFRKARSWPLGPGTFLGQLPSRTYQTSWPPQVLPVRTVLQTKPRGDSKFFRFILSPAMLVMFFLY